MANTAKAIFLYAISKGKANKLVKKFVKVENQNMHISENCHQIKGKNVHVVGFGKAAIGMAEGLLDVLGATIQGGRLIVPIGTMESLQKQQSRGLLENHGRIRVYEGAKNNEPDIDSVNATKEMIDYVKGLDETDLLVVLVSGGASALLCAPISPVTLEEKRGVVRRLAQCGASIEEINIVRRHLSTVKGGLFSLLAQPAQVVSLILSDIVGDPLDLIGSGPTVMTAQIDSHSNRTALAVFQKYQLEDELPLSIGQVLRQQPSANNFNGPPGRNTHADNVKNYLIGNNEVVIQAALARATQFGYATHKLSSTICGDAKSLGQLYSRLARFLLDVRLRRNPSRFHLESLCSQHGIQSEEISKLISMADNSGNECLNCLAIVSGGETVVNVVGSGRGGRNQECALSFSVDAMNLFNDNHRASKADIFFLAAGTDGIDGPTDAAGAIAYIEQGQRALQNGHDPQQFLLNNDSNTFYKQFFPDDLIVTGLTGTNFMDLHLLLMQFK